jgi:type VI secretion system protein ImpI
VLKLKIENFDQLPDGGPLSIQVDRRGFDLGRHQHLDWTLPDDSRSISGKHCEIRFFDGAYWLYDVSTNGTFVNKSTRRVQSPYKLANGDELAIGDYIISVSVTGLAEPSRPSPQPAQASSRRPPGDIWAGTGITPPPIDRQNLLPPVQKNSRGADFLNRAADMNAVATPPPEERDQPILPQASRPASRHDPWAPTGFSQPVAPAADVPPLPAMPVAAPAEWSGNDMPFPASPVPETVNPAQRPQPAVEPLHPQPAVAAKPEPPPAAAGPSPADIRDQIERDFIRQFARGANISEDVLARRNAGELAQELGCLMHIICANLMQLLTARAAAKTLARSGQRTLIQPTGNNPLKFMPSPEEALRVILGPHSDSYLSSRETLEKSFTDLKAHQLASLSAMQAAAKQLFEDLSPEAIEQSAGGPKKSLLGTNKSKFWDIFAERWNAKTAHHEHGMLGVFLDLFAEFYDRETRTRK